MRHHPDLATIVDDPSAPLKTSTVGDVMRLSGRKTLTATVLAAAVGAGVLTAASPTSATVHNEPSASATTPSPTSSAADVSSDPAAYKAALASPDWVSTPDGLMYKTCVHQLPPGARVDGNSIVLASGVRQPPFARCPHPRLVPPAAATAGKAPVKPSASTGWLADSWWQAPQWLSGITSNYTVPSNPSVNGALNYFFSSLDNPINASIVQPVLIWGGTSWVLQSWYLWNYNANSVKGPTTPAATGDTITASVRSSSCQSNGDCTWQIITKDNRTGGQSTLPVNAGQNYTAAQGGVFEVTNAKGCNMLPSNGSVYFSNIKVYGSNGGQVTPSFASEIRDQECSMYVDTSATATYIPWVP
jgi:hypothetical protein